MTHFHQWLHLLESRKWIPLISSLHSTRSCLRHLVHLVNFVAVTNDGVSSNSAQKLSFDFSALRCSMIHNVPSSLTAISAHFGNLSSHRSAFWITFPLLMCSQCNLHSPFARSTNNSVMHSLIYFANPESFGNVQQHRCNHDDLVSKVRFWTMNYCL
jgi:hypothetical protein